MKLTLQAAGGDIVRVRCEGLITYELDGAQANPLEELLGMGCYSNIIVVNLERATQINSTGVAWLVRCHRYCQEAGGRFVIHSIPPMVDHVLRLLNMPRLLHMTKDEDAALSMIAGAN